MMVTKFQMDAMSRADILEEERKDFYLYVDEFQNFATDSFATILSEARKYKLNLVMANQYIDQMQESVR
jgi:type IV secretory pathway TraG/TraD family ATPase VirD4